MSDTGPPEGWRSEQGPFLPRSVCNGLIKIAVDLQAAAVAETL